MARTSWHRAAAAILLCCWSAGLVAPLDARAHADRDVACSEPVWIEAHPGVAVSAERTAASTDEHCGLCHLQRAMRDVVGAADRVVLRVPAAIPSRDSALRSVRAAVRPGEPSRAPPPLAL